MRKLSFIAFALILSLFVTPLAHAGKGDKPKTLCGEVQKISDSVESTNSRLGYWISWALGWQKKTDDRLANLEKTIGTFKCSDTESDGEEECHTSSITATKDECSESNIASLEDVQKVEEKLKIASNSHGYCIKEPVEEPIFIRQFKSAYKPQCMEQIGDRGYALKENHNLTKIGSKIVFTQDLDTIIQSTHLNNMRVTEVRIAHWKKGEEYRGNPTLCTEFVQQGFAEYTEPPIEVYVPECLDKLVASYPLKFTTKLTMVEDLCIRVPRGNHYNGEGSHALDTAFEDLTLCYLKKNKWYTFSKELAEELTKKKLARACHPNDKKERGYSFRRDINSTLA